MNNDEIIREVRANREAYAERFDFDVWALYRDAKKHEGADGRKVVSLEPVLAQNADQARIASTGD